MPLDIAFSIAGHSLPCPKLQPGWLELGDIDYQYLNGSHLYIGMPAMTYTWPFLDETDVATIRTVYDDLIASFDPSATTGSPISFTAPDFLSSGWKVTTGYMTEPTGTAGGSGSYNFSVKLCNLGEQSLLTAMSNPEGNLWDVSAKRQQLRNRRV
jgi:hypothetical protein